MVNKTRPEQGKNITRKSSKTCNKVNKIKFNFEDIRKNKKLLIISLVVLAFIIYCLSRVIALIKNPTDTFTVEQGKIYQEEATTRIYY